MSWMQPRACGSGSDGHKIFKEVRNQGRRRAFVSVPVRFVESVAFGASRFRVRLHCTTLFCGATIMATESRLPSRFPVGTHYIVEGAPEKGGTLRILSRTLVMPSGARFDLTASAEPVRKPADLARKRRPGRNPLRSVRRNAR
jgi:hypothetical protein